MCKETLEKYEFIEEQQSDKIVLKPFMISYAEAAIDKDSKDKYYRIICNYYGKFIQDEFISFDRPEKFKVSESDKTFLFSEIMNIQNCLKWRCEQVHEEKAVEAQ